MGARFILSLKVTPAITGAKIEPALAKLDATISQPVLKAAGLVVLVVDDIATNRLVASTYLRMLGATMIEAESGEQALDILSKKRPDLVLLDMNMPEMDGLETLKRIRALSGQAASIPIIAMTANAMVDHRGLYASCGVNGYLAKPITPERMEAEIKAVLDKAKLVASD
jgi:CheY-like chemotaxis protein